MAAEEGAATEAAAARTNPTAKKEATAINLRVPEISDFLSYFLFLFYSCTAIRISYKSIPAQLLYENAKKGLPNTSAMNSLRTALILVIYLNLLTLHTI
ncbi:MAG: hypothetical protein HYW05_00275 [Candidatus Diapherotrites archaeon]|nr:hypothetical protein [Candidatus Diapherotrites archaeon]